MVEKQTLPNGVRLITEHMDGVRSAAVGVWVGVGSRAETTAENGSAHFIEHMLFKGTETRTAGQLAAEMDAIGGQCNACTTREDTCFYARVLDTHLDAAVELLADMFFRSRFAEAEFETERGVIAEEISLYDDEPEDLALERLLRTVFPGAPGRPVEGTQKSIAGFTAQGLRAFKERHYTGPHVVLALSGSFTDAQAGALAAAFSSSLPAAATPRPRPAVYQPGFTLRKKAIEQNHLCLGFPAPAAGSDERFALHLMSAILGGGMSSRLFQRVREERGLCYSVYSLVSALSDAGLFSIYAGVGRETEREALRVIRAELQRLCEDGVTELERSRALELTRVNALLAQESTAARMNRIGWSELALGSVLPMQEVLARYEAVTAEDIRTVAQRVLDPARLSFSAVGRLLPADEYRALLLGPAGD